MIFDLHISGQCGSSRGSAVTKASRKRDIGRKYRSGSQKKKAKAATLLNQSKERGSLESFLQRRELNPCKSKSCESEKNTVMDADTGNGNENNASIEEFVSKNIATTLDDSSDDGSSNLVNRDPPAVDEDDHENTTETSECYQQTERLDDPACWPEFISSEMRAEIVNGKVHQGQLDDYPTDKSGRRFNSIYFKRRLTNGEVVSRHWLVYSPVTDSLYCVCCKLFGNTSCGSLATSGFHDWKHVGDRLSEHEKSAGHLAAVVSWLELEQRLKRECSIDEHNQKQIRLEKARWRNVFERLLAIVQFLAEHNMAFRGSVDKLGQPNNGNFLGLVELIAQFDPVLQEHVRRVLNDEIHDHYVGKRIQNELVTLMGDKVRSEIIQRIQSSRYFAVILDCTPDVSHTEQMSLTIRYVSVCDNIPVGIYEHFVRFLIVSESTGKSLLDILLAELETLGLRVDDIRGQGYDNGANMKGHKSGVQARLLQQNSRAFFTPCVCHNYNLLLGDIASSCSQAVSFFGVIQRIYVFFSASTMRWSVFRENVKNLTVKPLSDTRWECRIESVKAVRYQPVEIREALASVASTTTDPLTRSEAESLCKELETFSFIVALVFWHDILFQVNYASKQLQRESTDLSAAVECLHKLSAWMDEYRGTGFDNALIAAREVADQLEVDHVFQQTRPRRKRKMFQYEADDHVVTDPQENFRIHCFNVILDGAISSIDKRSHQLQAIHDIFGFLYNFRELSRETLMKSAKDLEFALSHEQSSDIDGYMLAQEIEAVKALLPSSVVKPIDILRHIVASNASDDFPNFSTALRILLTIPVTVASGERSFSKLKLIKNYLRSSMGQERLNNLAILSIEHEVTQSLSYSDVIDSFAAAKSRKVPL